MADWFAQTDAALFLAITLALWALTLRSARRPVTLVRAREALLSTLLLVMVGVRYAVLAAAIVVAPSAMFAGALSATAAGLVAGGYAAVAAIGFIAHRGSVGWRVTGALAFAMAALIEAGANVFVLTSPITTRLDTGLSVAVAAVTLILAAFHWTRRAPTPNPLGSRAQPFDY